MQEQIEKEKADGAYDKIGYDEADFRINGEKLIDFYGFGFREHDFSSYTIRVKIDKLVVPNGIKTVFLEALMQDYDEYDCTELGSIVLPESVEVIEAHAFWGSSAHEILLPKTLKRIDEGAFDGCDLLTSLRVSDGITRIPDKMLCDCTRLARVTLPKSVEEIGKDAFLGCESLEEILFEGTRGEWVKIKKTNAKIPKSVKVRFGQ